MFRKILREWVMLPRSEQRALILLSLLLMFSLAVRTVVGHLPAGDPPDLEGFMTETQHMREEISRLQQPQPVELNGADSADLLPLPGIGPVFAARIIKYRALLGGYVSPEQFNEIYGLPPQTVTMLRERTLIDSSLVHKIDLNHVTFRELLRHPYLQAEDVKKVLNYRERSGRIDSPEELARHGLLPDSTLRKIGPYLEWKP